MLGLGRVAVLKIRGFGLELGLIKVGVGESWNWNYGPDLVLNLGLLFGLELGHGRFKVDKRL